MAGVIGRTNGNNELKDLPDPASSLILSFGISSVSADRAYFNPLLPGLTGELPALHRGQASGA